jgi:hypothetical protein
MEDWAQKFIDSDFMDQILAYKIREAIILNEAAIVSLESRDDLADYEKQDLEDCHSWAKSLEDVYTYFGGNLLDIQDLSDEMV